MSHKKISVVVPVYNEQNSLNELMLRLKESLTKLTANWEIIFVDDGSTDSSSKRLKEVCNSYSNVIVIFLRRNFGKASALNVGFRQASGDIVVTIDADLQDQPEEIFKLINKLESGYDVISGWKRKRYDSISKVLLSRIFNWLLRIFSGLRLHDINCGLKVYRKEVVKQLNIYGEQHRFLPLIAYNYGFKVNEVEVDHKPRQFGKSKYGLRRLLHGLLDFFTVVLLSRFGYKPAHFFGALGLLSFIAGFLMALYLTVLWFIGAGPIGNRPLLFLSILLMIIGIQLISLGLLGEMIVSQKSDDSDKLIREIYEPKSK